MEQNMENKTFKILIVDDDSHSIQMVASILQNDGYRMSFAQDGRTALENAGMTDFDLILLDIVMPGMDGTEVCKALKQSPKTSGIPVIFLTVKDEEKDITRGFDAGAVDYVTKPFSAAELRARVRTHMELKQIRDNLERLVEERTSDLNIINMDLRKEIEHRKHVEKQLKEGKRKFELKSRKFEELNAALKTLLQQREEDRAELEEKVVSNVNHLLYPHIEVLKKRRLDPKSRMHLDILASNLHNITSSFSHKLSSKLINLTPTEIKVASLVKEGKTTKDIAEFLGSSPSAVNIHRFNIRRKLGLIGKDTNLQTFLLSLS